MLDHFRPQRHKWAPHHLTNLFAALVLAEINAIKKVNDALNRGDSFFAENALKFGLNQIPIGIQRRGRNFRFRSEKVVKAPFLNFGLLADTIDRDRTIPT